MKNIVILGSTGSIGTQTIDVIINNPSKYDLVGFSVGKRIEYIDTILTKFKNIKHICVQLENDYLNLKEKYNEKLKIINGNENLGDVYFLEATICTIDKSISEKGAILFPTKTVHKIDTMQSKC